MGEIRKAMRRPISSIFQTQICKVKREVTKRCYTFLTQLKLKMREDEIKFFDDRKSHSKLKADR